MHYKYVYIQHISLFSGDEHDVYITNITNISIYDKYIYVFTINTCIYTYM